MRAASLLTVLASLAAVVVGQANLPACATTCLATAITSSGSTCGVNISCLCADPAFLNAAMSCLESTCSASDLQSAIAGAEAECASAGVTVNPSALTATGSGSASAAGSGTGTGSSASSPTTPPSSASASGSGSGSSTSAAPSTTPSSAALPGLSANGMLGAVLAFVGAAVAL